jgi:hypothetical protein
MLHAYLGDQEQAPTFVEIVQESIEHVESTSRDDVIIPVKSTHLS